MQVSHLPTGGSAAKACGQQQCRGAKLGSSNELGLGRRGSIRSRLLRWFFGAEDYDLPGLGFRVQGLGFGV